MYLWKTKSEAPPLSEEKASCNYHKPGFVYLGLLFLAGTEFSFSTSIGQRPDLHDLHVRDFNVHYNKKVYQHSDVFLLSIPIPLPPKK